MRTIFIIIFAFISVACSNMSKTGANKITARITTYTAHEDKYGARVACSSKLRAREGECVAMEKSIPFFTKVNIPALKGFFKDTVWAVWDRGSAVESRRASKGKFPVIDIFVNKSNKEMKKFASRLPQIVDAYLEFPKIAPNKKG